MKQKLAYGFPELALNGVELFVRLHLLYFYTKQLGLSGTLAGIALAITVFWDAITDPIIGKYSDQLRLRVGSRMPLILIGALASSLSLWLLYNPIIDLSGSAATFTYLLVTGLLFNTSFTLFSIPHTALVGDYSQDTTQRSHFIASRLVFANFGALIGVGLPGYFLAQGSENSYAYTSLVFCSLLIISSLVLSLFPPPACSPDEAHLKPKSGGLLPKIKNPPFFWLLAAFFLLNVGLAINSSAALYFYSIKLQLPEKQTQTVLLVFLLAFTVFIPFWLLLARWVDRKWALIAGSSLLGLSNFWIYPNLGAGEFHEALIWASLWGGGLVACSVLLENILTDVIDLDLLKHGEERFGLYYGIWKMSGKMSRSFALLLTGLLLDWAQVQLPNPETGERLGIMFGPGVGLFILLAALCVWPMGLNQKKTTQLKSLLAKKRDKLKRK